MIVITIVNSNNSVVASSQSRNIEEHASSCADLSQILSINFISVNKDCHIASNILAVHNNGYLIIRTICDVCSDSINSRSCLIDIKCCFRISCIVIVIAAVVCDHFIIACNKVWNIEADCAVNKFFRTVFSSIYIDCNISACVLICDSDCDSSIITICDIQCSQIKTCNLGFGHMEQ